MAIAKKFLKIENDLVSDLEGLKFKPKAEYVFNPLEYATNPHKEYVTKYCNGTKKVLFLGMNPGKWGMAQTGVPFGDVKMTRVPGWLKISNTKVDTGKVDKNGNKVTKFAVDGFKCAMSEQSGTRLWSLIKKECPEPEAFFNNCFVYNYCPLLFLYENEKNLTLPKLTYRDSDKRQLELYCDNALRKIIKLLKVETVVGIGRYAEERANAVKKAAQLNVQVVYLRHPSQLAGSVETWKKEAGKTIREYLPWLIPAESQ